MVLVNQNKSKHYWYLDDKIITDAAHLDFSHVLVSMIILSIKTDQTGLMVTAMETRAE